MSINENIINENICKNTSNNEIDCLRDTIKYQSDEIQILKHNIKYRDIAIAYYKSLIKSKLKITLPDDNIFESDVVLYSNITTTYKKNVQTKHKKIVKKSTSTKKNMKTNITPQKKRQKNKVLIKKKIPENLKLIEEPSEEMYKQQINNINDNIKIKYKSPVEKLWLMDLNDHENNISKLLLTLETARNYGKYLSEIKHNRLHFLKFLDEETYKKRVIDYITKIKEIFKKRGSDDKKIKTLMKHKIINAYEHRMLMLDDFEKTNIDIDEVNLVRECFQQKVKFKTQFEIYSSEYINQHLCSYQLCITDALVLISNIVTNVYGFNNIVYLEFDNNNYAFYYLEHISKNKRKWVMDCRLDDISNEIQEKALDYCILMFRKIYQKIFYDNVYRSDFVEISQVMELEGIQLLKNIIYLNNCSQFVKDFQNIITTCNKYNPTKLDEFNLFTDDPLFKAVEKSIKIDEQFKNVFDNITKKEATKLYELIQKQK
jgi:hypothetical protein